MKTAATVVIVLALAGLLTKSKKKETPPPPTRPAIVESFACGDPSEVPLNEVSKARILNFSKTKFRSSGISDQTMNEIAHYIVVFSTSYCVEPELVASLIARESGFNHRAVSRTGAKGLGQLIDSTARLMGVSDPFDIQQNLRGSIGYLSRLMKQWDGYRNQVDLALASYLQGPGNVEKHGGVPPAAQQYISEIWAYRDQMMAN